MKTAFFKTFGGRGHIMFDSQAKKEKFKACTRKIKYTNSGINLEIKRVFKLDGKMLYPYLCPHCESWHLTHTRQ